MTSGSSNFLVLAPTLIDDPYGDKYFLKNSGGIGQVGGDREEAIWQRKVRAGFSEKLWPRSRVRK